MLIILTCVYCDFQVKFNKKIVLFCVSYYSQVYNIFNYYNNVTCDSPLISGYYFF